MGWRRGLTVPGQDTERVPGWVAPLSPAPCRAPSPKLGWDSPGMAPLCPPPRGWGQPSPQQHPKPHSAGGDPRGWGSSGPPGWGGIGASTMLGLAPKI